ncbi:hypothetical protein GG344DRAFT_68916 [Lentinula edodes]|nr:hypothetical protein GG344DRAFT_68916 [Lentinula edodes]
MASQQQSGPLSDADIYALQEWIAETAVGFCLYGIYATFSFIAIYFLLTRHGGDATKKARLVLLTVIIFMFINSTSLVILDLEYILVQIPLGSFNPPDIQKTTKILGNIKISGNFLERLNFLINDGIVVWRAWILFPRNWHIKLLLGFCLLACGVSNVFDAASGAVNVLKNYQAVGAGTKEFLVLTLPLLVTNIVATFLIGYKALKHRQDIIHNLSTSSSGASRITMVQKILSLLVESGSIYISFWIAATFLTGFADSSKLSFQVFIASALPFLSGLYPVLIILLVALENTKDRSNEADLSLSQSIHFATRVHLSAAAETVSTTPEAESPGDSVENPRIYNQPKEYV